VLAAERSASKSAASRAFVGRTGEHLQALMSRSLADLRLAALMLDGIDLKGRCCVVALGVTTDGVKVPLGLWDGSTENKTITVALLGDLVDRGLDVEQGVLVVLDGVRTYVSVGGKPGTGHLRRPRVDRGARTGAVRRRCPGGCGTSR
jgi:putative transposase